jgi:hypothetical protein
MSPSTRALRLLAPYLAVGVFWCWLGDAWLTLLAYHAQILFWRRGRGGGPILSRPGRGLVLALPAALAGPAMYWLLPRISSTDPAVWLSDHGLSGTSLLLMIPYYGLVHPLLEQLHWRELREGGPAAPLLFAGYHLLVLHTLLTPLWLAVCFAVLVAASFAWRILTTRTGGLTVAVVSHVLADLGVVLAAWWRS